MTCLSQIKSKKPFGRGRRASRQSLAWAIACLCLFNTADAMAESRASRHDNSKTAVLAQDNKATITGTVTDGNGEPLVGATISAKGKNENAVTDIDGRFAINVPVGTMLTVSYIGMEAKEVVAQRTMSIVMSDNVKDLEDLVVVGYGVMKKKDLTGSIASVGATDIANAHATSLSTALQGAAAGLTVTRNNGTPDGKPSLLVRGVTTISDTSPLVIIDGVPGDIANVNPDDVETLSVLKDAASAAIYGSRAAAGVILITTKRAKNNEISLNYSFEQAYTKPTVLPKYVGWKRFMQMVNETHYNDNPTGGEYQTYAKDLIDNYERNNATDPDKYPITQWEDYLFKNTASQQTHSLSIMGGGKNVRTKLSLRYDKNAGLYANRNFERYIARLNNDLDINPYIEAHVDANFAYTKLATPHNNPFESGARNIPPIYAAYWRNGNYGDVKDGENILAKINEGGTVKTSDYSIAAKGELVVKPLKGLRISLVAAPNFTFHNVKDFVKELTYTRADDPLTVAGHVGGFRTTSLTETRNTHYDLTTQALANYTHDFGLHSLTGMAGFEYYYMRDENLWASGDKFQMTAFPYLDLSPRDARNNGGNALEYSYRSAFARVNYAYANRYLLEANVRYDGSSRFHKDYRWATFPSVSAGWVISEENFFKDNVRWMAHLKLRASYGQLGNERIGSYYPYQSSIRFGSALLLNGTTPVTVPSAAQVKYAVKDITWETTETWDVGFDAHLLDARLGITFDWYRKNTRNMLLPVQIPIFLGYENPDVNAGDMHTNGFDLELRWRDRIGKVDYWAALNLSDYTSMMGNMRGTEFTGVKINREGSEFMNWYGYVCDGIYQTQADVDNSPKLNNNVAVGDLKYRDISGPDGKPDGKISAEYDRVPLKGSLPHFVYGLNLGAAYNGFDFSLSFQGVGKQWSRKTPVMIEGLVNNWTNFPELIDGQYWSKYNTAEQNASAQYPRLTDTSRANNYTMSDFWLFNGWYLRCKNITLGYTLPKQITQKALLKQVRLYLSANDLFAISNYPKGWDPEVTDNGYPIMRSLMFGLNVNF